ncbi:hypothetical protein BDZ94DRAFT_231682 [Collybia nuda]|uniref:Secreted protein n=1 Tax=Collybia nuda TaxID=64659 RepID=A0A9P6C9Q2_9AGAR|nr:hypothetical protein BDZ94DRAFT_231682 [Collybia nuda]
MCIALLCCCSTTGTWTMDVSKTKQFPLNPITSTSKLTDTTFRIYWFNLVHRVKSRIDNRMIKISTHSYGITGSCLDVLLPSSTISVDGWSWH